MRYIYTRARRTGRDADAFLVEQDEQRLQRSRSPQLVMAVTVRRRAGAYKFGAKLKSVIETARQQGAELIGAHARDVIFNSCATESNNAAIAAALCGTGWGLQALH